MNSLNKASIKKNIQNRSSILDNEVRQDLAKIFDNAMDKVDDYEEDDVTGGEIRRSASNWSEKINYALDELPSDHPLRKNGKIQKLVNKLDAIVHKPDNEVTYDVMVAGGKPPSVSKQRFWAPIARLLADAQVDVIKPSAQTDAVPYQEPQPGYAPQRQANLRKDKPKVSNIPDQPKLNLTRLPKGAGEEKPFTREVPVELRREEMESGAKPGYSTRQILAGAINGREYTHEAFNQYEYMINAINEAQQEALKNKANIDYLINTIKELADSAVVFDRQLIDNDDNKNNIDKKKRKMDAARSKLLQNLTDLHLELFEYLKGITKHLDDATSIYGSLPPSMKPPLGANIDWNVELGYTARNGQAILNQIAVVDSQDIRNSITTANENGSFISKIEMFLKEFYDGHAINKIKTGLEEQKNQYQRLGQAYTELMAIDKDKQVYNDFMKILGDKTDSKSIRLAISQYVNNVYNKK